MMVINNSTNARFSLQNQSWEAITAEEEAYESSLKAISECGMKITETKPRQKTKTKEVTYDVYVRGVKTDAKRPKLKTFFSTFGTVRTVTVRGVVAFVRFQDKESMDRCVAQEWHEYFGQKVHASYANRQQAPCSTQTLALPKVNKGAQTPASAASTVACTPVASEFIESTVVSEPTSVWQNCRVNNDFSALGAMPADLVEDPSGWKFTLRMPTDMAQQAPNGWFFNTGSHGFVFSSVSGILLRADGAQFTLQSIPSHPVQVCADVASQLPASIVSAITSTA
jgi:hypothetical protein